MLVQIAALAPVLARLMLSALNNYDFKERAVQIIPAPLYLFFIHKNRKANALRFCFLISLFLCARGFTLLAALYARAFIMLSLTQLGENA